MSRPSRTRLSATTRPPQKVTLQIRRKMAQRLLIIRGMRLFQSRSAQMTVRKERVTKTTYQQNSPRCFVLAMLAPSRQLLPTAKKIKWDQTWSWVLSRKIRQRRRRAIIRRGWARGKIANFMGRTSSGALTSCRTQTWWRKRIVTIDGSVRASRKRGPARPARWDWTIRRGRGSY